VGHLASGQEFAAPGNFGFLNWEVEKHGRA
jgi:hypothetical protein